MNGSVVFRDGTGVGFWQLKVDDWEKLDWTLDHFGDIVASVPPGQQRVETDSKIKQTGMWTWLEGKLQAVSWVEIQAACIASVDMTRLAQDKSNTDKT